MAPILLLLVAALLLADCSWAFSSIEVGRGSTSRLLRNGIKTTTTAAEGATTVLYNWRQTSSIMSTALRSTSSSTTIDDRATSSSSSSSSSAATSAAPVQRVAIIGAGVAGLSLAHALRSTNLMIGNNDDNSDEPIQIDVFDARPSLDEKAGSGVQLTGGMAALRAISPELQRSVSEAALPLERVVSTCRPWFGSGSGGLDEGWKLLELNIREEIQKKFAMDDDGGGRDNGLVTEDGEVLAYTILRGTLQRILEERLVKEHGIGVQFDRRLCGLSYNSESTTNEEEGISCQFTDGSRSGPYDLVVGCDGIQSAVREYVNTGKIAPRPSESSESKNKKKDSSAIYSGLRITFAIQEGSEDENNVSNNNNAVEGSSSCQFTQFFGNGAYALTSSYGAGKGKPPARGAFLVYTDPNYIGPFPKSRADDDGCEVGADETIVTASSECEETAPLDENPDWTQDKRTSREHVTECLGILQSASIPGNDVANIIEKSDRFFDLGVYLHNPFSLNGWVREVPNNNMGSGKKRGSSSGKYAVTAGDASHAMPPFLGQGANQAFQDSCSLAAKIHEYNAKVQQPLYMMNDPPFKPDLMASLKEYENKRWLPTTSITVKAAFLGYLEVGPSIFSNFRDAFFFVMGKIGVAKKVFLDAATPKM